MQMTHFMAHFSSLISYPFYIGGNEGFHFFVVLILNELYLFCGEPNFITLLEKVESYQFCPLNDSIIFLYCKVN